MTYEVTIDTGLPVGKTTITVDAEDDKEAHRIALETCYRKYPKEYRESQQQARNSQTTLRSIKYKLISHELDKL